MFCSLLAQIVKLPSLNKFLAHQLLLYFYLSDYIQREILKLCLHAFIIKAIAQFEFLVHQFLLPHFYLSDYIQRKILKAYLRAFAVGAILQFKFLVHQLMLLRFYLSDYT